MKKVILLLIGILALISCKKETQTQTAQPNSSVFGRYDLAEVLMDPGNGSGTFQPVNSNKIVELFPDGSIESNGDICSLDPNTPAATSGTYSLADSSITMAGCPKLNFELSDSTLIINYPCIEACKAKYRKSWPLYPQK